jgi:two-component system sensor histidine kinase QseC
MLRQSSVKRHILVLVLGAILLGWGVATIITYLDARHEMDEVLDAHLAQASTLLVAQASHELEEIDIEHGPLPHRYSLRVAFQIWQNGHRLRLRSANAPDTPLTLQQSGFSNATVQGRQWRVFSTWDNIHTMLIHVAEQTEVRDALARNIAVNLLTPLIWTLPLLGMLIWLAVRRGLTPLTRLAKEVEQRAPDHLTPLDLSSTPNEVTPLIERLNQLFQRFGQVLENERRFTADAAHELRTPVAAIKAQAQVAQLATEDAVRQHALSGVIAGCDRASHLIEQLLVSARLEHVTEAKTERCELHTLATQVIADMAPAALDKNIHLALCDVVAAEINGVPAMLCILLRNLIDNAIRHSPPGSFVNVEVLFAHGQPTLMVIDDGPGLPEEERNRIAERFYRPTGTTSNGSGLGLSIVKHIAELHHATLSFSSVTEKSGLKVTITFPLAVQ